MDDVRQRLRSAQLVEPVLHSRPRLVNASKDELIGYFAWGYLSRRELNERLRFIDATPRRPRHVPRRPTRSAA